MSRLLIVDRGSAQVTEHRLGARTLLGRTAVCDVVLDSPTVSRRHAFIERTDLGYMIEDIGSAGGTYVNEKHINGPYLLKSGDQIRIGQIDIVFHSESDKPSNALLRARHRFAKAELPLPPVPDVFVSDIEEYGDWWWGTRKTEGLYQIAISLVGELTRSAVMDYVIFGHGGHGANSYAMHYFLVYEQLALFTEIGFGGAYMDPEATRRDVRRAFQGVAALIDVKPQLAGRLAPSQRLLVHASTLRDSFWHVVGPGPQPAGVSAHQGSIPGEKQTGERLQWHEALDDAMRWARY